MAKVLNSRWTDAQRSAIREGKLIDFTSSVNIAIQFTIEGLAKHGRPFKVYRLGAGVTRVTTDTDVCPCCKQKLKKEV